MSSHTYPTSEPFTPDAATLASIGLIFAFLPIAQIAAHYALPKNVTRTHYYLFLWCAFDVLTHSIVEGSYLFHCFFSYIEVPAVSSDYPHPASLGKHAMGTGPLGLIQPGPFLGRGDRLYGAFYGDGPMARLWREYAKADRRWGGADPTVISLELLTVFGAGPLALYICTLVAGVTNSKDVARRGVLEARMWFCALVLSTAELYGGFITFAPEWLTMNSLLGGDDPVYLWLYLVFFNMVWVVIPFWIWWAAWGAMKIAFVSASATTVVKKRS